MNKKKKIKERPKIYNVKIIDKENNVIKSIKISSYRDFIGKLFDLENSTFISTNYNNISFEKATDKYLKKIDKMLK